MLDPKKPQDFKPITEDQRLFVVVPFRAIKDKKLTIQRMRALMTICSYANSRGTEWAGVERLAEDMGIARSTMAAHIKYLTERGYLKTVNNSYTVGKHAKPRAIVYDPNNPPNDEEEGILAEDIRHQQAEEKAIKEERVKLLSADESTNEVLAKPASLYQCYRSHMLNRFGTDLPYDKPFWDQLSHRYTLESFKKVAGVFFGSLSSPPANPRALLRFSECDPFPPAPDASTSSPSRKIF